MVWVDILSHISELALAGGLLAIVTIRDKKTAAILDNYDRVIKSWENTAEERHKRADELKEEKRDLSQEFDEYKEKNEDRFLKLEARFEKSEKRAKNLDIVILHGYRCHYPPERKECPVISEYEKRNCNDCLENK